MNKPVLSMLRVLLLLSAILWPACARGDGDADKTVDLKDGFFLLRDVCHEETQVDMITMVKTTPDDVTDYVERISKLAKASLAEIDEMEARRESLKQEDNPLPDFEQKVRSAIRADKEHQLLFGTKGAAFARALIVTQIEASNYISVMSKTLADEVPRAGDERSLRRMSGQWLAIRDRGFRLLGEQ